MPTRDLCRTGAYKRINRAIPVSTDRFNTTAQASQVRKFRWTTEMMEKLIMCIKGYKARMEFQGLDFDGDRSAQYREVRKEMASIYSYDTNPGAD